MASSRQKKKRKEEVIDDGRRKLVEWLRVFFLFLSFLTPEKNRLHLIYSGNVVRKARKESAVES